MDITILPGKLHGTVQAIPSKSQAHRYLICAAFADRPTMLICPQTNRDIEATADCLRALGADIAQNEIGYHVQPIVKLPSAAVLPCGESGSTLRFLLPIIGALGVDGTFLLEGRLPHRPLSPMWEEMGRMGCQLTRPTETSIRCTGQLRPGEFTINGGVSSQFVTGLLFAMALLPGYSHLHITGQLESKPYVDMTLLALSAFGVTVQDCSVHGCRPFSSPGQLTVEGDWSNGAFFLVAKALECPLEITNLDPDSPQGDRAAAQLCNDLEANCQISAADIPDLVPVLSVLAAAKRGAVFTDIQRLRLKESDRVAAVIAMLTALGGRAEADANTLTVYGTGITGGTVDSVNDHRIAMSAAIAATAAKSPVTIFNAQCVAKSYPAFWQEYQRLGGHYEQYIR